MDNAIEISGVSKVYPGVIAVDNITFSIGKGEVHGFIGPNGAGKTTTMKMIAGILNPNSGSIRIHGVPAKKKRKVSKQIGYLPENPCIYFEMKVRDYIVFVAKINGVSAPLLKNKVDSAIEKTGLKKVENRLIGNLSKGYKQRVGIAGAIVFSPSIIILDEPTSGLDPNSIIEIRELIKALSEECTVLLSTHLLHEAHNLCSHITIINNGSIVESGKITDIQEGFKTRQIIKAVIHNWSDDLKAKFLEEFTAEDLIVEYQENNIGLKIFMKGEVDMRSSISKFFVNNNCELLSFEEENYTLEEIFKIATIERKQGGPIHE